MTILVNVTPEWGIGQNDRLLVSLPEDLRRFRQLTLGKTIVCGRKTLLTFPGGRPLPGRRNIILSAAPCFSVPDATVVRNEALLRNLLRGLDPQDICVVGGESVFRLLLPFCDSAHITRSYVNLASDRFFPDLDAMDNWYVTYEGPMERSGGVSYRFIDYVNRNPLPL